MNVYIMHELIDKMNSQYIFSTDSQFDEEFTGEGFQPLKILVKTDVELKSKLKSKHIKLKNSYNGVDKRTDNGK